MPDGMRGDPEADILGKGLNQNIVGPCGGLNPVDYGKGNHNVIRVLSKPGTARVMLAQAARAPFADRNGKEKR